MDLIRLCAVKKHYKKNSILGIGGMTIKALDGIDLTLNEDEVLGIVGESGCGKSTLGKIMAGLEIPTDGQIHFMEDKLIYNRKSLKNLRQYVQIIFQNHTSTLDPRWKVSKTIEEPLINYKFGNKESRNYRIDELLDMVGLEPEYKKRYPHELSGGQRQRVNIARALALPPKLIICDEPVSNLDVSARAQILNLFLNIKKQLSTTYLFISHDLAAVSYIADRIAVMYLGRIVEIFPVELLGKNNHHPYTNVLLAAVPKDPKLTLLPEDILKSEVEGNENALCGCKFYLRCPAANEKCKSVSPTLKEIENNHYVACNMIGF